MRAVVVQGGWEGWRRQARALLALRCPPDAVLWDAEETAQPSLLGDPEPAPVREPDDPDAVRSTNAPGGGREREPASASGVRVPRAFVQLGEAVACHSDPARWSLLYRALWRIAGGERHLLAVAVDPLVRRLYDLEKQVRRDVHKMRAFVRFRRVSAGGDDASTPERYVAWFEPDHDIVERNARFFVERFGGMAWSILTPRRSLHWDGEVCWAGPGVSRRDAPRADALDDLWRTYYAHTYNPARTRWKAMTAEMPVKYWKNLPEARLIPLLVRESPERVRGMLEREGTDAPPGAGRRPRRWAGAPCPGQESTGPHGVTAWPDARGPHGPAEADGARGARDPDRDAPCA